MNNLERKYDDGSSLGESNNKVKDSISSVLIENPHEIRLNYLGILLGDLGNWDKDNFLLNKNLIHNDGDAQYIIINNRKYFIKDKYDNTEGEVFKMGEFEDGESPFFFVGNFSKIDGYGTLVKKDGHIYEGKFVISNNRRIRYDGLLRFPNGDTYVGDFIDGEPITENSEEFSPFKKKGTYTKLNGDKKTYRYYGKAMGRPYFVKLKDYKSNENWAHNRGNVISIMEENQNKPVKGELSSRGQTTNYIETDSEFIFQTKDGKNLVIQKDDGDKKDREVANLINAIKYFYEKHDGKKFFTIGDNLKYRYGKLGILVSTLLSNVSEKIGNSDFLDNDGIMVDDKSINNKEPIQRALEENKKTTARNLAKWLNCYYESK